ncbi:hypothetical protein AS4_24900 [Acinetobacter guillouiae]|nr:hypothetical protein AS4_24900 [Acinetobacter guillouiae]
MTYNELGPGKMTIKIVPSIYVTISVIPNTTFSLYKKSEIKKPSVYDNKLGFRV